MIALYILIFLILLVLFLLYVNVHIIFRYRENATVTVRVLFFRMDGMKLFRFVSERRKKREQNIEPNVEADQKEKKKKRNFDPLGFVEFLVHIARVIGLAVKEHFSKMKINLKELYVLIGTDDAAKTALIYGGAIQAANALCVLLQRFSHFQCNNEKLVISPDFTQETSRFSIHLDLCVKPVHIIALLLRTYFRFFEGKEKENERNPVETSHRRIS